MKGNNYKFYMKKENPKENPVLQTGHKMALVSKKKKSLQNIRIF